MLRQRSFAAISLVLLVNLALILAAGHGLNFRHDEWDVIQGRFHGGLSSFLEPLNEHISIVPLAIYRVLFRTAGLSHYFWYRFVLAALDAACGYLIWVLLRRRVPMTLAIGLTAVIVFCGAAYENFIFGIEIGQVGSLLGGLAAWVALDRDGHRSPAILTAVAFSLASSAIGVPVLLGVGVEVVLRRQWRLVAGLAVLATLFVIWYLEYGRGGGFTDIGSIPAFLSGLAAYTLSGVLGLWPLYHLPHDALIGAGALLVVAITVLAIEGSRRGWWGAHGARALPRIAGLVAMLACYWLLVAVSRSGLTPYRSRYMEPGAIVFVLLAAEFLGPRLPRRTVATLTACCAVIVVIGVPYLVHNAAKYRLESQILNAQLGTLERAHNVPAGFQPAPTTNPQIKAGLLAKAECGLSSHVGASADAISHMPGSAQAAAAALDRALLATHN